jgi:hypothetical protein
VPLLSAWQSLTARVIVQPPLAGRIALYLLSGKRAQRLGTIAAPDRDAAIATAIERYNITDPERQKRVAVSPME